MLAKFVTESFIVMFLFGNPREVSKQNKRRTNMQGKTRKAHKIFVQKSEGGKNTLET
jgi:hypothetical protein